MGAAEAPTGRAQGVAAAPVALRLYVAGAAPNSVQARTNLARLLARLPADAYTLEVVDCLRDPQRALRDGVLVTPMLVKASPGPTQTLVGTLADAELVSTTLGLAE